MTTTRTTDKDLPEALPDPGLDEAPGDLADERAADDEDLPDKGVPDEGVVDKVSEHADENVDEDADADEDDSAGNDVAGVIFGVSFWVVIAFWVALSNDTSNQFLRENWEWFAVVAVAAFAVGVIVAVRWKARRSGAVFRAGLVLGFGLPMIVALVLAVTALPEKTQLMALRSVFLLVVIFTPTIMWWLFVAAQRQSLLNEFIANLDRLGLLENESTPTREESQQVRQTRVSSYLQKFEANFVEIPKDLKEAVARGDLRPYARDEDNTGGPLATTAVPVLLTLVVLAVGWLLTLPPTATAVTGADPKWLDALVPHLTPVTMAFLGAYFFSLQMIFRRYVRRDLRGSAYVAVVMRVVLAVVGTWVVVAVANDGGWKDSSWQLLTTGFVIGVFPKVAWQIVQVIFAKIFRLALPSMEAKLPLSELDGLTVWHEARLEEEDIENIPNMASADLVELLVSTRYASDRLIDWVDQAILLAQLGPEQGRSRGRRRRRRANPAEVGTSTARDLLATYGIRNASTLLQASRDAEERAATDQFNKIVTDDNDQPVIPVLLVAVRTNCNFSRILRWRGIEPTT
jgi:hypothetical protein